LGQKVHPTGFRLGVIKTWDSKWFATKDYENGMQYMRRKAYDSAILYFRDIVTKYPNTARSRDALLELASVRRSSTRTTRRTCARR
jgi:outer membrane protein assembly factor BamD (BamD/ComL family)